jgi:hypothetical protein
MGFLNAPGKLISKIPGAKTLNKPVNKMLSKTPGLRNVPQKFGMAPKPALGANSQGQGFAQQQSDGIANGVASAYNASKTMKPSVPTGEEKSVHHYGMPIGGSMGQESPAIQSGLPTLKSPYDTQQQAPSPQMSPMQQAAQQMQGYEGPDLGSQDPRELARTQNQMQGMTQLYGTTPLQAPPFSGNQPGSNSFQSMMEQYGGQRPDVVRGGIGPSAQMFGGQPMDELRRGPR